MGTQSVLTRAAGVFVALVVISLLAGQLIGQPVGLSYVETGSMAPTLQPGDGFIAIPMAVAGPVEENDVIVFQAVNLHGGGLVTHRVVGESERGFITKGDANPVTDQSSGENEPPVQREQVVAKALQVGGNVVVIPALGTVITTINGGLTGIQQSLAVLFGTRALLGTQGLAYLFFALGVVVYLVSTLLEEESGRAPARETKRRTDVVNMTHVVAILTLVLVLTTTATMVMPSGPQPFEIISSQSDAPGARVIPAGGSENATYRVPSSGLVPVVVFLEPGSDGIDVEPRELYVPSNQVANATVTLHAPPETGVYRRYLVEHRYLAVLPQSAIRALYLVHPWMPVVVIDFLLGVGFATSGVALVGLGRVRTRSRSRSRGTLLTRVQRWLR